MKLAPIIVYNLAKADTFLRILMPGISPRKRATRWKNQALDGQKVFQPPTSERRARKSKILLRCMTNSNLVFLWINKFDLTVVEQNLIY